MIMTSMAKIFLAEDRGMNETNSFRSFQTFNFGKYFNPYKTPVDRIYLLNDDMLDGGRSISMLIQEDSFIVLLPVAGAIRYHDSLGNETLIAAGQVQIIRLAKDATVTLSNPFADELVNFVQLWIKSDILQISFSPLINTYDVNEKANNLVGITGGQFNEELLPFSISMGKFKGRVETVYRPEEPGNSIFIFVLEGAFEVEGRLLHARDGLALWQSNSIEMEALSNDAIILLVEQKK